MKDQTLQEKRAAADAAKEAAAEARRAADAAPTDAALKEAADEAQAEATQLETEAKAPSHEPKPEHSKKDKIKLRMEILRDKYLAEGGDAADLADLDDDESRDSDDGHIDDNKPITRKDLQNMGVIRTAESMIGEIADSEVRTAVSAALGRVSKSLSQEDRYQTAVALASSGKNARVAQEIARMGNRRPGAHVSGGAPAKPSDEEFTPTPLEQTYMTKYKLTKADVVKAREDAAKLNFGQK